MALKDLFFKETTEEQTPKKVSKGSITNQSFSTPTSLGSNTVATVSNAEKNEFLDFLNEVYQKGNFPGPDYQEYTDAIKGLDNEPMDEKTKFNAVFAGFKVQGVTKTRLIDTAQKYISLIEGQAKDFSKEIDGILSTEIAQKQAQCTKYAQENADIEKQMIALTEKKNKNNEIITKTTGEINEQVSTLNIKKTSFESAASDFIGRVQLNITKINQYLS